MIGAIIVVVLMANLFSNIGGIIKDIGQTVANVVLPGQPFGRSPSVTPVPIVNPQQQNVSLQPNVSTEFGQGRFNPATGNIELIDSNIRLPGGFSRREGTILPKKELAPGQPFNVPPKLPKPPIKQPEPEIQQTSKEGGFRFEQPKAPEQGAQGVSSGQFSISDTGISGISGGQSLLPGSIAGTGRFAGLTPFIELTEEQKKNLVAIQREGSIDLFDPGTGVRLTPEEAAQRGAFTITPGQLSERVASIAGETPQPFLAQEKAAPLTAAELAQVTAPIDLAPTSEITEKDTETGLKDLRDQIFKMIEAGTDTLEDFKTKVKEADTDIADTAKQLRDLELFTIEEIKDIADNPNFSLAKKQRKQFWLSQSPQSPTWLAKIALTNKLQFAKDNRQTLLDSFELNRKMSQDKFNNTINLLEAFKISNIQYQTVGDTVYGIYVDPATGKLNKTAVLKDKTLDKSRGIKEVKVYDDGAGQTYREVVYNDGTSSGPTRLGSIKSDGILATTSAAGQVFADAANNLQIALPKAQGEILANTIKKQTNPVAARDTVFSAALAALPASDASVVRGKYNAVKGVEKIEQLIKEYEATGGNTNLLTGNINKLANKAGIAGNAKLVEITTRIALEVQQYTRAQSGAAFTDRERAAYEEVFPSTTKTSGLNLAKTKAIKDAFNDTIDNNIGSTVGFGNWSKINESIGGTITTSQNTRVVNGVTYYLRSDGKYYTTP